jgi:hypothetical protein
MAPISSAEVGSLVARYVKISDVGDDLVKVSSENAPSWCLKVPISASTVKVGASAGDGEYRQRESKCQLGK